MCGPEQDCPPDQACNGPDNTCVLASFAAPFACDPSHEHEPDDTAQQGLPLGSFACVSTPVVDTGCLAAGDGQDWVVFTAPMGCTAIQVDARLTFPVAFEPLGLELWELGGMTKLGSDTTCTRTTGVSGEDERCLVQPLTPGASYGIAVEPAGGGDCGGACNYNRYQLTVQLDTP